MDVDVEEELNVWTTRGARLAECQNQKDDEGRAREPQTNQIANVNESFVLYLLCRDFRINDQARTSAALRCTDD